MKYLYSIGVVLLLLFSIHTAHASNCAVGDAFSSTTGLPCTVRDCAPGDLFSAQTGKPCTASVYLPGCFSTVGYSVTTGTKCDGSVPLQTVIPVTITPITTNPPVPMTPTDTQTINTQTVSAPVTPPTPSIGDSADGYIAQVTKKYPSFYIYSIGAINMPGYSAKFYSSNGGPEVATMTGDGTTLTFTWLDGTN
jgi:hypothetical protein